MSVELYRFIHFAGLITMFLGLGCIVFHRGEGKPPGLAMALHGVGWLAVLVAGFGLMARTELAWSGWVFAKAAILVLLGALPILVRKKIVPLGVGWLIVLVAALAAVWFVTNLRF